MKGMVRLSGGVDNPLVVRRNMAAATLAWPRAPPYLPKRGHDNGTDAGPMTKTVDDLVSDFELFDDWEERYAHILDMGRKLEPIPEDARTDANKVRGCMSQVWLVSERETEGGPARLHFRGDSDAHLVKGLIALLMELYDRRTPEEILALDGEDALRRLGLTEFLSAQRRNGLVAMLGRIRQIAESERAA